MTSVAQGTLVARDRHIALFIAVAGLLVQLPGLLWGVPDGKAINNALRILDGDLPYRDFWTMYAPGHFYLLAVLFKLFGVHVWVPGIGHMVIVAIDAAFLFILCRRLGLARVPACLLGAASVGMKWGFGPSLTSYETALLFLLPALDRVVAFVQGRGPSTLIVVGLLCGVAAWFKHDISFYVAVGIVTGLSVSWLLTKGRRPSHWISPIGVLLRVGGGAILAVLPVVAFLALKAGSDAWRDLILFPATDFRVVRGEAYPPLLLQWDRLTPWLADPWNPLKAAPAAVHVADWIQANAPQLVFAAGVVGLAFKRRALDPAGIAAASVALATMPLFWASAHVQHNTNFSSLWILSVILGAIVWPAVNRLRLRRGVLVSFFIVHTGALLLGPLGLQVGQTVYFWRDHATLEFPSVAGVRMPRPRYEFMHPIVAFIRNNVPEEERIYAGLVRHDAVVVSNQNFYYLSGRRVASRYNELHPGIVDREEIQREIIADLNRLNVRCAVLWEFGWPKPYMDNMLAARRRRIPEIGATLLDEYFANNFEKVARFGEYILVWRKGVPMPPPPAVLPRPAAAPR